MAKRLSIYVPHDLILQAIAANTEVGMVVKTMIIGGHQDVHLIVVAEAILLLVVLLMLKGQGGTDQGHTLLMEALTEEDMGVDLVPMADKKIVVSNLGMNGTIILSCGTMLYLELCMWNVSAFVSSSCSTLLWLFRLHWQSMIFIMILCRLQYTT